jgi:hypothetical protein
MPQSPDDCIRFIGALFVVVSVILFALYKVWPE